ncbi:MAG TPA: lipopolysaccharide heptosyltransferase II [Candidatus Omnitrophica bacterium]|nr:lipopolysaccharide heptosyltransferase II [Candidatus Omnitrophota bacterium]
MNILQIVPELNVGGVETGTIDLAKYLVKCGHKCVVVSAGGELVKELDACGIRHYRLPVDSKAFWVMIRAARALARIIEDEHIEIVHARSRVPAWVAFMGTLQARAIFVTTAHGSYSKHIFSYMMGWGKYTIVPSSVIGRRMVDDFGVPFKNIRLIPRSVDLGRYFFHDIRDKGPQEEFLIGVIGRITPIKGQIYFLKALAKVLRSLPHVKAQLVGSVSAGKDNYMEELEVCIRRLGLSDSIKFLGLRRDIPELLSHMDCLVMPSIAEESFGRVIVEAQASGVPVVATRVGGVVEIIDDGKDGILVHPRDPDGLAEAILRILKDPEFAYELACAGRKKVEDKFSLEKMADDTIKVYREALDAPRILVIKISAIGDAILAVPSFEALKKKFPASKITCLVGRQARDVFQRCQYIDELIVCDLKGKDKGLKGMWSLAWKIARRRFDMVIDLQNNRKSHAFSFAACCSRRYGYDNGKLSFLLSDKIKDVPGQMGPVAHQFRVLEMLGISYSGEKLQLWPSEEDKRSAQDFLSANGIDIQGAHHEALIGINIGASPRWQTKRWIAKKIAKLCDSLAEKGYRVLLTGSSADAPFAKKVLKDVTSKPICSVAQTTLLQLASLIGRCDVFITSDSAPLHIAAAMGVPFVALFGPTSPERHLPPADRFEVLRQKGCPPCYKDTCKKGTNACMAKIEVKDVLAAVERLLKK